MSADGTTVRIDKWLWASRFFKTRSMASQAVSGGKVHLNGSRVKPARAVAVGDMLLITRGHLEFHVKVLALSEKRGPAVKARELYEETAESVAKREADRDMRRALNVSHNPPASKPNKRDRRKIKAFIRKLQD